MSHFAYVQDGTVREVIVAEQDFVDSLPARPGVWVQTSYNTLQGEHLLGGTPLRKNYAGIGYTYDETLDAFIPPKPYIDWVLNETKGDWEAPTPYPTDGNVYYWDEYNHQWVVTPSVE